MIYLGEFDKDTIHRYTHGGCVYLAAAILKRNPKLDTIALGSEHFAVTDGKYVIDIYGVWRYKEWHEWWKQCFNRKRFKITGIDHDWVPSQSKRFGEVRVDDVQELASLLYEVYEVLVRIRDRKSDRINL